MAKKEKDSPALLSVLELAERFSALEDDAIDALFFDEEEHLDRLKEVLEKVRMSGGMSFFAMEGFLHGIICHADLIPPSVFLPEIFGEESNGFPLAEAVAREAAELILLRYNYLLSQVDGENFYPDILISSLLDDYDEVFDEHGDMYEYFDEDDDTDEDFDEDEDAFADEDSDPEESLRALEAMVADAEERLAAISDEKLQELEEEILAEETDWAQGFLYALRVGGGLERFTAEELSGAEIILVPFAMLARNMLPVEEDSPEFGEPLSPEDRQSALHALSVCVEGIYQMLHSPVRRTKIARNDPCPCGSGKKYKRCCLNRPSTKA